jgi:hypothetical protein
MSLAFDQLNLVHTVDSRTDVNSASRKTFAVMEGPNDVGYIHVTPDGGVSNSSMTFTINPPSARVFVNRRMLLNLKFRLTFTGVSGGAGQTLLQAAGMATSGGASAGNAFYDAPRAYPLANATNSMQVSINNDRLAQNLNLYFRGMTRYNNSIHQQDSCQSMTPSMLDQSQQYSDLDGFARSPLRGYGDNFEQTARGGFVGAVITQNTSTGVADTAVVELDATEFFWLSPFLFEEGDEDTGFIGVQNMMLTLQLGGRGVGALSGLAAALWSHSSSSPSTFSAIQVDVLNANVISSYLTPDTVMQIPMANNYPYSDLTIYPTQSGVSVPSGSQALIQMNNVQLNSIPSRIFVWVAPSDSTVDITSTDTYFRIDNVNISFDNHDAILSNATEQDLYQIAVKNRCNLSWTQWHKWTGSVLALDFGTDIPLRPLQAVGLSGSYNLRMTIQATNLSSGAVIPTLSVLAISEGIMTIDANRVIRTVGVLSRQDVLNTKEAPLVPHRARNSVYGGSFWDSIKNFFSGVARPALDVARTVVPLVAPQFAPALEIADKVGRAVGVGRRPRAVRGGRAMPASRMLKLLH